MAERRMFSKTIVNSARFLRMPPTSRLLYYDLGMNADDDGIVEAFTVMRTSGATEDDLRVLAARGFIRILNEDLVSFIMDWKQNNQIRSDRYKPSVYSSLLVQIGDESNSAKALNDQTETDGKPDDNQRYTDGKPTDNHLETQYRLGKDRLGKDSVDQASVVGDTSSAGASEKPARHKYGQYQNVLLSDEDLEKLKSEFSDDWQQRIERLSEYIASKGAKYKNHLATIRAWAKKEAKTDAEHVGCNHGNHETYEHGVGWNKIL